DERWTLAIGDTQFGSLAREAFRARGLGLPGSLITSSLPVRQALVATGRYLTMVPRVVLAFAPASTALQRVAVDLPTARGSDGLVAWKNRPRAAAARLSRESVGQMARPLRRDGGK